MASVVVDKEVVEALIELKAWMDSIPQERLEGLSVGSQMLIQSGLMG